MFLTNVASNSTDLEHSFRSDTQVSQSIIDNHSSNITNNQMDISDMDVTPAKTDLSNLSNLKVTVGIDEDLQMILEMDPSIVDLVRNQLIFRF